MSQPVLYGIFASPFVRKVRLVLAHKGIAYEAKQLRPRNDDPDFIAASPLGKIPAFRDEHAGFSDSSVIVQYLERFYPGPKLIPETPAEFARCLWLEEYADAKLVPILGGHLFAEVVLAERLFKRPRNQADIDLALNSEIPEVSRYLETQLGDRQFLVDDSLSLADIAVVGSFMLLYHCGLRLDASATPKFAAYVERLLAQAPFAEIAAFDIEGFKQFGWEASLAAGV